MVPFVCTRSLLQGVSIFLAKRDQRVGDIGEGKTLQTSKLLREKATMTQFGWPNFDFSTCGAKAMFFDEISNFQHLRINLHEWNEMAMVCIKMGAQTLEEGI